MRRAITRAVVWGLVPVLAVVIVVWSVVRDPDEGRGRPGDAPSRASGPCAGVERQDVVGTAPRHAQGPLAPYPNDDAACRAAWLPRSDDWFVPQGLALDGKTAWVSGYAWRPKIGTRYCQAMRVDLRTGKELAFQARLETSLPDGRSVVCRHGGGAIHNRHGLWVAEKVRLWLLDPERIGTDDAVRRVWSIDERVSGGFLVTGGREEFALGDFRRKGRSTARWFRFEDALRDGVTSLVGRPATQAHELGSHRTTRTPRYAQGGGLGRGRTHRPFLVASTTTCAVLETPDGDEVAFGPGAEGIAFDGRGGLWAALESGTRAYQEKYDGRPLTPGLVRYDAGQLLAGERARCSWLRGG